MKFLLRLGLWAGLCLAQLSLIESQYYSGRYTGCIGGDKCDQCTRGYVQKADLTPEHPVLNKTIPEGDEQQCFTCGECFTNWDRILSEMNDRTKSEVDEAQQLKATGATGSYYKDNFGEIETNLQEVRSILEGGSISNEELEGVHKKIEEITDLLTGTTQELDSLDSKLADTKQAIVQAKSTLAFLKSDADRRKDQAMDMKDTITRLQEANVEGALNLTGEARDKSMEAKRKVEDVKRDGGHLSNSETQRKATEALMTNSQQKFTKTQEEIQQTLTDVVSSISHLEAKIPDLNNKVCDGQTSVDEPCDQLCGGAGCGKCGGISCLDGALSKAGEAVKSAELADKLLRQKDSEAQQVLTQISQAHSKAETAAKEAQEAHDLASEAKQRSVEELERSNSLTQKIEEFTNDEKASPASVQALANECLSAELNLDQSEIERLAVGINNAVVGVPDVDEILANTTDNVEMAEQLKNDAEAVQNEAKTQLDIAEKIIKELSNAAVSQDAADLAVAQTRNDIDSARTNLGQIQNDMEIAVHAADNLVLSVSDLGLKQVNLQRDHIKNENRVNNAAEAAMKAKAQADNANTELYHLNNGFKNVSERLAEKTQTIGGAKDLAMDLQKRANDLAAQASNKLNFLSDVEYEFEQNEQKLNELSKQLMVLNCNMQIHLQVIEAKANYHRTCTPPGTWEPTDECECPLGAMEPVCKPR